MEDLSKYLSLFVSEATEHVDQLTQSVESLSDEPFVIERVDEMFRHAHSVKGMAAAMSFEEIVSLAHAGEQVLGELRNRHVPLPRSLGRRLVEAADRLASMIQARGRGEIVSAAPELVAALTGAAFEESPAVAAAVVSAAPGELSTALKDRLRGVRVRTELLDDMTETAGELLLGVARLRDVLQDVSEPTHQVLEEAIDRLHVRIRELHGQVTQARLTPLSILTEQLPRHVREIARRTGRGVELSVTGAEVEIDRSMVEDLADVVLHLLRNCIDHGIEPSELRRKVGKPEDGRVAVRAQRERDQLLLEVSDDGRGFSPAKLRDAAVRAGRLSREQADQLSDVAAIQLACLPGISTASAVTDISGRGIGLDVAKLTIESFGGSLEIDSSVGRGTTFRIALPLTVSLVPVLLAEIADEVVALPIAKVQAALDLPAGGRPLRFNGRELEVRHLGELLGFRSQRPAPAPMALVVGAGEDLVAVAIDRLVGQQEAVVKPLSRPLDSVPGLAGVTLLGSGQPVFILEVGRLLSRG